MRQTSVTARIMLGPASRVLARSRAAVRVLIYKPLRKGNCLVDSVDVHDHCSKISPTLLVIFWTGPEAYRPSGSERKRLDLVGTACGSRSRV